MTPEQWRSARDPQGMLSFLRDSGAAGERKLRLWGCACARAVWDLLPHPGAVAVAELHADEADDRQLVAAHQSNAGWLQANVSTSSFLQEAVYFAALAAAHVSSGEGASYGAASGQTDGFNPVYEARQAAECCARARAYAGLAGADHCAALVRQADLLRDIFHPFQHFSINNSWLTPTVLALANAAYIERDLPSGHLQPARLAVLADALEEAGCADADLIGHLRSEGPHVRGCWALDAVLGRS